MDRDEMSNHYRGPSIDASYQASVHLAVSEAWTSDMEIMLDTSICKKKKNINSINNHEPLGVWKP
jgi:hypothetical protein